MKRAEKINWRRKVKIRKPVPMKPNKFIVPETMYNRKKDKPVLRRVYDYYS